MSAQRCLQNSKACPEILWAFFRLYSFHGQQSPESTATRHFLHFLGKGKGQGNPQGMFQPLRGSICTEWSARDTGHAPELILVQPLVSSLFAQPWLQGHGGKAEGWTTPQLPPGEEKEDENQDGAGTAERGMPGEGVN